MIKIICKYRKYIIYLIALLLILPIYGCARNIVLYPIQKTDILSIPAKSQIVIPNETFTTNTDGWYISNFYLQEILEAKIQK